MKPFSVYQHLPGESLHGRDVKESGSKFWGKGKWDNFILPLLPKNCLDMTLLDMGCNAGLFLKLAKDNKFYKAMGVDTDTESIGRGIRYRDKLQEQWYDLRVESMDKWDFPVSDYTLFVNTHYYLNVADFTFLLDKLRNRTRYCLVVSGNRQTYPHIASSKAVDIRRYFGDWIEEEGIPHVDPTDDPSPRNLFTLCFKSPTLKRVSMSGLDCGNNVQSSFYEQLDQGIYYTKTKYYKILRGYRLEKNPESLSVWTEDQLNDFMESKIKLYSSVKRHGLKNPIVVNKSGRILDGNHRFMIMKHLGHKTILTREV